MSSNNTMNEYLRWRGDLTFNCDPFNEVDNLILAQLSYVDFDGIVSEEGEDKISLSEVNDQYWKMHTEKEILARTSFVNHSPFLLKAAAATKRFGEVKLSGYVNHLKKEAEAQMSAICFELGDGTSYVAFRGTDETIIGWKEDFNLSYMSRTEGQRLAVEYLNRHFKNTAMRLRVGGHSKGGNFAVFAAAYALPQVRAQIEKVYSNDAPGFLEDITGTEEYRRVLEKTINIIPSESIIGRLFESGMKPTVVGSSGKGIFQHDALTWQVMGNRFVHVKRSDDSLFVEKVLDNWIRNVDVEARRTFVDTVFQVLSAGGGVTMKDVRKSGFSEMVEAVTKLPREQQKETIKVVRELLRSGEKALYQQIGLNDELPGFIRKWASKRGDEIEAKANRQEPQLTDKSQSAQKPEKETASDREEVKESKDYSFEEEVRRLLREKTPEKATSEAKG